LIELTTSWINHSN